MKGQGDRSREFEDGRLRPITSLETEDGRLRDLGIESINL
jgi:hypothetical protein